MAMHSRWKDGIAWGLYDFANSGYFLVYVALTFPLFLSGHVLGGDAWFETKWGLAQGTAILVAVVLGLGFGRRMDREGIARVAPRALVAAGTASLALPLLIALGASGNWLLVGFVLVHAIQLLSLTVYDASLKHIATGEASIEVSGWAWGWGYIGGLVCMALMAVTGQFAGAYSAWTFLTGSVFFLVFSVLAARQLQRRLSAPAAAVTAKENAPLIRTTSRLQLLLLFILIVDGIAIFMGFFSLFATKVVGALDSDLTKMLAVLQVLAFPLTGLLSGIARKSFRALLLFCGSTWFVCAGAMVLAPNTTTLWVATVLIAAAVGTTQALLRAVYASTLPTQQAISGFSVFAVVEKGAAFIGPIIAGILIPFIGYSWVFVAAGVMVLVGCLALARRAA